MDVIADCHLSHFLHVPVFQISDSSLSEKTKLLSESMAGWDTVLCVAVIIHHEFSHILDNEPDFKYM